MPVYDNNVAFDGRDANTTAVRGGVRIPRSSPRTCRNDFAKLLRYVDPDAHCGFGFEGLLLRPGSVVTDADLWPTREYPRIPILLEAALVPAEMPASRRRMEQLYILWRYDAAQNRWCEIARARSLSWHWALELRSVAIRALAEQRTTLHLTINLGEVQQRIASALDRELRSVDFDERWSVLGIVHDQLAGRLAAAGMQAV